MGPGVQRPEPRDELEGTSESGMHRNGDADETRGSHRRFVERLDGEVDPPRFESRIFTERHGKSETEGLVAELVAGQEQYGTSGRVFGHDASSIISTMPIARSAALLLLFATRAAFPQSEPQEATLKAEYQEQIEKGHSRAEGYVDLRSDDVRITADRVEFWNEEMRVIAEGNVVYEQGDQKIIATRMEADLKTKTGRFFNAHGRAGTDLYFYGDIIEKESEDAYVIEGGAFHLLRPAHAALAVHRGKSAHEEEPPRGAPSSPLEAQVASHLLRPDSLLPHRRAGTRHGVSSSSDRELLPQGFHLRSGVLLGHQPLHGRDHRVRALFPGRQRGLRSSIATSRARPREGR